MAVGRIIYNSCMYDACNNHITASERFGYVLCKELTAQMGVKSNSQHIHDPLGFIIQLCWFIELRLSCWNWNEECLKLRLRGTAILILEIKFPNSLGDAQPRFKHVLTGKWSIHLIKSLIVPYGLSLAKCNRATVSNTAYYHQVINWGLLTPPVTVFHVTFATDRNHDLSWPILIGLWHRTRGTHTDWANWSCFAGCCACLCAWCINKEPAMRCLYELIIIFAFYRL
jgi:hypothetical protein